MQLHAFQMPQRRTAVVVFPGLPYIPMPKGRGIMAMFNNPKNLVNTVAEATILSGM
jgi:hypothetical protein